MLRQRVFRTVNDPQIFPAPALDRGLNESAGAIDFVINWGIAQKPWLLLIIGVIYGLIYYFAFRFVIIKWNLRTPGREDDADEQIAEGGSVPETAAARDKSK